MQTTFYGNEVSKYGLEHGFVDYRTLAKCFGHIMNNTVITIMPEYWELVSGYENEEDYASEVMQWYIVTAGGAEILGECGEIVYYNSEMDMYLWGVTHYGTSWDYVLTNIKLADD